MGAPPIGDMPVAASPAHSAALAALHAVAFPPGEQWSERAFASQLGMPGVFGLITGDAGFVLARVAADEAEILTIGVVPASRRRGIGATLLAEAERRAEGQGARVMFLDVAAENLAARALYAAFGYQQIGRRPRYYADGTDALVLARSLSPCAATSG
jgi:ribosomal-protein-alanine N-acetyltransferase